MTENIDWADIADDLFRAACGHERPMPAIRRYQKAKMEASEKASYSELEHFIKMQHHAIKLMLENIEQGSPDGASLVGMSIVNDYLDKNF